MHPFFHTCIRKVQLFGVWLMLLTACEIEDEHGTPKFVAGLQEWTSQHGEMLSQSYVSLASLEFLVSEENKEIFFLGCQVEDGWCETHALISINYETSEAKELFTLNDNSWLYLIPNQPLESRLLFLELIESEGVARLHVMDLDTYSDEIILSLYIHETRLAVNQAFVIHNNGYDSYNIFKTDYSGHTEKLLLQGEVVHSMPNNSKILMIIYGTWNYALYDYDLEKFVIKKASTDQFAHIYSNSNNIYYLEEYGPFAIRDFVTDDIIIQLAPADIFLDFNPNCHKVLVMRTTEIGSSNPYINNQLIETELLVSDLEGNVISTEIRLIDEYLSFARILNDGKTIIYNSDGKFYITSIE